MYRNSCCAAAMIWLSICVGLPAGFAQQAKSSVQASKPQTVSPPAQAARPITNANPNGSVRRTEVVLAHFDIGGAYTAGDFTFVPYVQSFSGNDFDLRQHFQDVIAVLSEFAKAHPDLVVYNHKIQFDGCNQVSGLWIYHELRSSYFAASADPKHIDVQPKTQ